LRFRLGRCIALLALLEAFTFLAISHGVLRFFAVRPDGLDCPLMHSNWAFHGAFSLITQTGMLSVGLYSPWLRTRLTGLLTRALAGTGGSAIAMLLLMSIRGYVPRWTRMLLISAALSAFVILLLRLVFLHALDRGMFQRRVMIYGTGSAAVSLSQLRRRSDRRGFRVVGYVQPPREPMAVPTSRLLSGGSLCELALRHKVQEIVIAIDERRNALPMGELLESRRNGVAIIEFTTFLERETGRVDLSWLRPSWIVFGPGFRPGFVGQLIERILDVLGCCALLAVTWPVLLTAMLAIKLEDGWRAPVLYRQKRVGLHGKLFEVLKLRSMCVQAEQPGQATWAKKKDPRVTRVGAIIRLLRIDELPQIFNILRGDMSFVGPRPERPEFVERLDRAIPYYSERHCIKPGLTGWAQISYPYGSSEHDAAQKLQYDLYYVKNHSPLFALYILLQTAEVVLWGKGAR
jgi:sugar transferase (PEP-CTERM system associated)